MKQLVSAAIWLFLAAAPLRAATITIVNADGPGEGFNDPTAVAPVGGNPGTTRGQQRLNVFEHAAGIWGALVASPVEIRVSASFDPLPCSASSATLGQAGPHTFGKDFAGAPSPSTWYPVALANALAGVDLDPGNDDIDAQFNSNFGVGCAFPGSFYLGLDANPPGLNDSDLVTVVLHELGHGLGFLTLVDVDSGSKAGGFNDVFMLNLEDHSLGMSWPLMSNGQRAASSIDTGDLHWTGGAVVAASGGLAAGRHPSGHVQMYAPSPTEPGSSVSHFDVALSPDEVMEPTYTGANHDPGLAVALLGDLGWDVGSGPGTTTTTTTLPALTIDGYACDKATVNVGAGGTKLPKTSLPTALLADGLGSDTCTLKKEERVCPPIAPAQQPAIEQVGYQLRCATPFVKQTIAIQDTFGTASVTLSKRAGLLVPSGMIDLTPLPPPPPQTVPGAPPALTVDHYLCYKAKGRTFKPLLATSVADQFAPGGYPGAVLVKLTRFCTPVNVDGGDPGASTHPGHLACYQMKLLGGKFPKTYVSTNNGGFGAQVLKVTATGEACLPAYRLP